MKDILKGAGAVVAGLAGAAAIIGLLNLVFRKEPDHVFDEAGQEVDCQGKPWDQCIAAHCLGGYETIQWRDLGGSCTYRCKPKGSTP